MGFCFVLFFPKERTLENKQHIYAGINPTLHKSQTNSSTQLTLAGHRKGWQDWTWLNPMLKIRLRSYKNIVEENKLNHFHTVAWKDQ